MGLDRSSLLLAALSEFPAATSESPSWTTRAAILASVVAATTSAMACGAFLWVSTSSSTVFGTKTF